MITWTTVCITALQTASLSIVHDFCTFQIRGALAAPLAVGHNHIVPQLSLALFECRRVASTALGCQGCDAGPATVAIGDADTDLK